MTGALSRQGLLRRLSNRNEASSANTGVSYASPDEKSTRQGHTRDDLEEGLREVDGVS